MNFLENFYNKDFKGMWEIPDRSIDVMFTSPPYKFVDGFSYELMHCLTEDLFRVMSKDGMIFLNFGQMAGHKDVPLRVALILNEYFNFVDTIIWEKPQYDPVRWNKRLNNRFEYIFQFANGTDYQLDRLSIGIPYEDKSNVGRYSDVDLHCRGNVWKVGYKPIQNSSQKLHKNRFPVGLVELGILLSNRPGGNFLDPFTGSGSSILACHKHGMHFYGYEIDPERYNVAVERFGREIDVGK